MKHIFFIAWFCCLFVNQLGAQHWIRKGGGLQQSEAYAVAVDADGNTYTTGYFTNSVSFGSLNANSTGLSDIYLVKTDSTGNFLWLEKAGGSGVDRSHGIAIDNAGNVFITGIFTGSATFGSTVINSANSSQDIFLAKYNSAGVLQWVKQAGGNAGDAANAITVDNFGNVFITGFFEGQTQFDATTLTSTINPVNNQNTVDVFIAKYNSNGNLSWVKQGATKEYATGIDLTADNSGNVYVTGQFSDTITFDSTHPNNSFNSIFIVKYDSTGSEQWFKMMGAGTINSAAAIVADNSSNVYLTGNFQGGTIIFGTPNITLTNPYLERIFIVKFNSGGNVLWTKTSGSASPVSAKDISLDNIGDVYLTGNFQCKFSEFADQYGQGTFNSVGYKDVFVAKYDATGIWQWARQFGGKKDDTGNGISLGPDNHVVICGNFTGAINFPVNTSHFYAPVGDYTPFAVNYNTTCCGDTAYGTFAALQGTGTMNIFIAKPIDLTREPYDYYKRNGAGCSRDFIQGCMQMSGGVCVADTIIRTHCVSTQLPFNLGAINNTGPGPDYTYIWSNNTTTVPTLITNPGPLFLTITTEDGCFTSHDTTYVVFDTLSTPPPPPVTDSYGINVNATDPTTPILICPPDSQVVLTGVNTGSYYYWTGHSPGNSPLSITATVTGSYAFYTGSSDSCETSTQIMVEFVQPLDSLVPAILGPDTVKGCEGVLVEWMAFNTLLPDTYCITPPVITNWTVNMNVSWLQPTCLSDGMFLAHQTGLYEIYGTIIRQDPCGINDTHYVSKSIFVEIYPNPPPFSISISGDLTLCPGDSTTLTATGAPPNTTYQWYNLFFGGLVGTTPSITVGQPGDYIAVATTANSFGCIASAQSIATVTLLTVPVIQMTPSSGVICPGGSVDLFCPTFSGSWQWYGPSGAIGGNVNNITVSSPGSYYCIYTDPDGCELTLTPVQVQHYATPYLAVGPTSVICPGQTVTIEVVSNAGGTIQWLAPLAGNVPTQVISTPGTYSVNITSCGIQTTTSITIAGSVVEAIINPAGPLFICFGDSVLLTANPGMDTYNWMPGNITSQNMWVTQSGLYELTTTENGCSATASIEVYTYSLDPPFVPGVSVCQDSLATLIAYSTGGITGWFDAPNGNLLDTGSIFITPFLQNTTTFYFQSFDSSCYSVFDSVTVTILPSYPAPFVSSNAPLCEGDTLFLQTTFSDPNAVYHWSGPGSFSSNIQNPVIANTSSAHAGQYQLVISSGTCPSEPAIINVIISTLPPDPQIFASNIFCEGDTILINTDTVPGGTYHWSGPNGFSSSSQQVIIPSSNSSHSGNYSVYISLGSCISNTSQINIIVNNIPTAVNAFVDSPICTGDSIILNSTFVSGYNYNWLGPANFSSNNYSHVIYPAELFHSGIYILNVENSGCYSPADSFSVIISQSPEFSLGDDILLCAGNTTTIFPDQHFDNYLWNTGHTGYELIINHTGMYTLTVTNAEGCRATDMLFAEFTVCNTLLPNIFTPNNDGYNDVFTIPSEGMIELYCKIFNRWGDLIYEFNALTESWDGTHQSTGKHCADGVYYYVANAVDFSSNSKELTGFIHLVRSK